MKILILSAKVGGGHMVAAEAIEEYSRENARGSIKIVDAIEISGHILNKIIISSYKFMARRAPFAFKLMYNASDKTGSLGGFVFYFFLRKSKKLLPLIFREKPDVLISTHPFAMEMASALKSRGIIDIPLVNVMTDYVPHRTWISEEVDAYVVATEDMIEPMEKMGACRDRINAFGIPVRPQFFLKCDKRKARKALRLHPDKTTVLLMAGSFGVKDVFRVYNDILGIDRDFQIILITGNNKRLYRMLRDEIELKKANGLDLKGTRLIMFTNQVSQYMKASDLLITKPGGLTISEALASDLPMGLFKPIPGQEEGNRDFLIRHNMAFSIKDSLTGKKLLYDLLGDRRKLDKKLKACQSFDKSRSCEQIIEKCETLIEKGKLRGA